MIEHVRWPEPAIDELSSPFLRGEHERPLRITFHTSMLDGLSAGETEAFEALLQLSHLPEIETLQTEAGTFPHLEIGAFDRDAHYIPVAVRYKDRRVRAAIHSPRQWQDIAAKLVGQADPNPPDVEAVLEDLIIARAHCALHQDILITSSPWLLGHRTESTVWEANPCMPTEAAKIVGLFLRSRGNYTYWAMEEGRAGFNRGLFYWVLVRHRLPSMWRYFSACVEADRIREDDILYLGQSILTRCVRALEARDAIGEQFYIPQDNSTRDRMMYHFDYLTLVLAGAFDAQARVAHRAYRINRPKERSVNFRRQEFLKALKRCGSKDLYELVSGQYFQDVMTLLYEPRNTIHGSGLPTLAYQSGMQPEVSFVSVPSEYHEILWEAAERCGSPERWGLAQEYTLLLKPYTYSVTLVAESFKLIDAIAAATDVAGLFPDGYSIPYLRDGPPEDGEFGEQIRKRLAVLG